MSERIRSLLPSLVGGSIEYRNKSVPYTMDASVLRDDITQDSMVALSVGGELCVMLLAELTNYYRNRPYYMMIRSAIVMHRYRPAVLEYLQLEVSERAERLKEVLSGKLRGDRNRELKLLIAKYFLSTYSSRLPDFEPLLTKAEYITILSWKR